MKGKTAVVTGGSRGIGRAMARRLAEEGASVAICARGEDGLRDAERELRSRSVPVYAAVCDVGDHDALDVFLHAARGALGRVDVLVNNPRTIGTTGPPDGTDRGPSRPCGAHASRPRPADAQS